MRLKPFIVMLIALASPTFGSETSEPSAPKTDATARSVLETWEERTRGVENLQCRFDRYIYERSVGREVRSGGRLYVDRTYRFRIDSTQCEIDDEAVSSRTDVGGNPLRLTSGPSETWIFDQHRILAFTETAGHKQYSVIDRPNAAVQSLSDIGLLPRFSGADGDFFTVLWANVFGISVPYVALQNPLADLELPPHELTGSPSPLRLPFDLTTNVSAKWLDKHFVWTVGTRHTWRDDGFDQLKRVHLKGRARYPEKPFCYATIELLLDGEYFLPRAVRIRDSFDAFASETVYVINPKSLRANQPWVDERASKHFDPFEPDLRGYKCLGQYRIQPVNHAEIDGDARADDRP